MDTIDQVYNAIHALKAEKDEHDPEFLEDLAGDLMKVMTQRTGEYLHNLHKKQPKKKDCQENDRCRTVSTIVHNKS